MIKTVSWWIIFWWSSSVVRWVPSLIIRIFWKFAYFFFKVCKISSVSLWITSSLLVSLKGLSVSIWSCFPSLFSYSWIAEEKCLSESEIWRITNMVIEEIKWCIFCGVKSFYWRIEISLFYGYLPLNKIFPRKRFPPSFAKRDRNLRNSISPSPTDFPLAEGGFCWVW